VRLSQPLSGREVAGWVGQSRPAALHRCGEIKKRVHDAREAKAFVPSALYWYAGQDHMPSQTATPLQHAVRVPDPRYQVHDEWLACDRPQGRVSISSTCGVSTRGFDPRWRPRKPAMPSAS
jgi:hypothetical protein